MIFLTIGTHEPFDRLVKAMDNIAMDFPNVEVIAQISNSSYVTKNIDTVGFITPTEFDRLFNEASLIVSHAGMGTIISALEKGKPIIVMPRKALLNETRNDHQLATVKSFKALNYIYVAESEVALKKMISKFLDGQLKPLHQINSNASDELLYSLKEAINS